MRERENMCVRERENSKRDWSWSSVFTGETHSQGSKSRSGVLLKKNFFRVLSDALAFALVSSHWLSRISLVSSNDKWNSSSNNSYVKLWFWSEAKLPFFVQRGKFFLQVCVWVKLFQNAFLKTGERSCKASSYQTWAAQEFLFLSSHLHPALGLLSSPKTHEVTKRQKPRTI